jgi:hypothetical protein
VIGEGLNRQARQARQAGRREGEGGRVTSGRVLETKHQGAEARTSELISREPIPPRSGLRICGALVSNLSGAHRGDRSMSCIDAIERTLPSIPSSSSPSVLACLACLAVDPSGTRPAPALLPFLIRSRRRGVLAVKPSGARPIADPFPQRSGLRVCGALVSTSSGTRPLPPFLIRSRRRGVLAVKPSGTRPSERA